MTDGQFEIIITAAISAAVTVGGGVLAVVRYLAKKFFNDKEGEKPGFVPRWVDGHLDFLESVKSANEAQKVLCAQHAEGITATSREISAIRKAYIQTCNLYRKYKSGDGTDSTAEDIQAIIRTLECEECNS